MKEHETRFTVGGMARVLGVSRSGYYAWRARRVSGREMANQRLLSRIRTIHQESRETYGSPRVYHTLRAAGVRCGRHRPVLAPRRLRRHIPAESLLRS